MNRYPTVLIIAGSDPSGGAGIQADLKTCTALGVYGMTAITALTAQNTTGVRAVSDVTSFLDAQLNAVLDDIRPDAVKIGMLPSAESVHIVAETIRRHRLRDIVLDPVMVATSGDTLAPSAAVDAMRAELLPLASVVTPNIAEAEVLSGRRIMSEADVPYAAHAILDAYHPGSVLVKGAHLDTPNVVTDHMYVHGGTHTVAQHPRIVTPNTHGTGCTLSSAIAANLALHFDVPHAVLRAEAWLAGAIAAGARYTMGHGHGPVNHLYKINCQ